jgi:osmotically inducible protein OsmC
MSVRKAHAEWEGNLARGKGQMSFGSYKGKFSFSSRFENGEGTNPEELIGAAEAGCFTMELSHELDQAGYTPKRVSTNSRVHLDKDDSGFSISRIELLTEADVPGIDQQTFKKIADNAKSCIVSRALKGVKIELKAELL